MTETTPPITLVLGVAGSGKTTAANALAALPRTRVIDADDFHPPANKRKMARGEPLTDADREPWLRTLRAELEQTRREGRAAVLACSALKRRYRAALLEGLAPPILIAYLEIDEPAAAARVARRAADHFMPASLVADQFAALEPPAPEEAADLHATLLTLDAARPAAQLAAEFVAAIRDA